MTDNFDGFDIDSVGVPKADGESWDEAAYRLRGYAPRQLHPLAREVSEQ